MGFDNKIVNKEIIYRGKIFDLSKVRFINEDNTEIINDIINHNGSVCMLCVNNYDEVCIVKQYRASIDKYLYELPAGLIEANEDEIKTGIREIREECGIKALNVKVITRYYPSCGYSNEVITILYCDDFIYDNNILSTEENITVKWIKINELVEKINRDDKDYIFDSKLLIGILYLKNLQNNR